MNEKVPAGWTFAIDDKAEQMPTPTQQPDPELKQVNRFTVYLGWFSTLLCIHT